MSHNVSPSTRAEALSLTGTVSVCPARISRIGRSKDVRATRLRPTRVTSNHGTLVKLGANPDPSPWNGYWLLKPNSGTGAGNARKSARG